MTWSCHLSDLVRYLIEGKLDRKWGYEPLRSRKYKFVSLWGPKGADSPVIVAPNRDWWLEDGNKDFIIICIGGLGYPLQLQWGFNGIFPLPFAEALITSIRKSHLPLREIQILSACQCVWKIRSTPFSWQSRDDSSI